MHEPGQIHVRLPGDVEEVLMRTSQRREIPRAQAVRTAILVWGWLDDQRAEGRRVVSLKEGDVERELMWP